MKKIILDTDIGIDCDDAIALALLINLAKKGYCQIEAITTSTSRVGATATIATILEYYGYTTKLGKMHHSTLECDNEKYNKYANRIMDEFHKPDIDEDSVKLFRKVLTAAEDKITLITIGPLSNIYNVLISKGDEISSKTGQELFNEKISEVYSMAGCFRQKEQSNFIQDNLPLTEWNTVQDTKASKYVFEHINCNLTLIPAEVGRYIFSGQNLIQDMNNPVFKSLLYFHQYENHKINLTDLSRESWDPITCYIAIMGTNSLFDLSNHGRILVDESGYTTFIDDEKGKHNYVKLKNNFETIKNLINNLINK